MVVSNGIAYYTSQSDHPGTKFGPKLDRKGQVPSYLESCADVGLGARYSVTTSSFGILIRTPLQPPPDEVVA